MGDGGEGGGASASTDLDLLEIVGDRVQPAFFHPAWTFSGLPADAPIHFEKRACASSASTAVHTPCTTPSVGPEWPRRRALARAHVPERTRASAHAVSHIPHPYAVSASDYALSLANARACCRPLPVINLLRRASLDRVVEQGLRQGVVVNQQIAEHNAAALEAEGYDALTALFRERLSPGPQ